jgi:hypothetical protein
MITLVYDSPPTFIEIGKVKKRKIYLGYNAIYAGIHYSVRQKIVQELKEFLWCKEFAEIKPIDGAVRVEIIYFKKSQNWDIDNRVGLWAKVLLDMIKGRIIKDDNVRYVPELRYIYKQAEEDRIEINIIEL